MSLSASRMTGEPSDPIVLVFAADEGFSLPLAVSMYSALVHLSAERTVEVYVIDHGLSPATRTRLQRRIVAPVTASASLTFISGHKWLEKLDVDIGRSYTPIVLLRLFLSDMLPDTEKVLYLDCDLVLERSVESLWERPVDEHTLLGVQERRVDCPARGVRQWDALGLEPNLPYLNSGVLVMNLRRWRAENLARRCLAFLRSHAEDEMNVGWDQEAINAVRGGTFGLLDPRWNVVLHYYWPKLYDRQFIGEQTGTDRRAVASDPFVIHYTSPNKPWCRGGAFRHPKRDRFFHYLRRSRWLRPIDWLRYRAPFWAEDARHRTRALRHRIRGPWSTNPS
jgi:lipopolysaccharide biosynthesis glycosyltransferase